MAIPISKLLNGYFEIYFRDKDAGMSLIQSDIKTLSEARRIVGTFPKEERYHYMIAKAKWTLKRHPDYSGGY